jgi:hypothetical protein
VADESHGQPHRLRFELASQWAIADHPQRDAPAAGDELADCLDCDRGAFLGREPTNECQRDWLLAQAAGHRRAVRMKRAEVDAERHSRHPDVCAELLGAEVGGAHHGVARVGSPRRERADHGAPRQPIGQRAGQHRVVPVVGEQNRRDATPLKPHRDPAQRRLVGELDDVGPSGVEHPLERRSPRQHPVAARHRQRRPGDLFDAHATRHRRLTRRPGMHERAAVAGSDVPGSECLERPAQTTRRRCDEVGDLDDAHQSPLRPIVVSGRAVAAGSPTRSSYVTVR